MWPATLVIPVFIVGMPAKLTRAQLRRHDGGKALRRLYLPAAHVLIRPGTVGQTVPAATLQIHRRHMPNQA